MRRSLRPRLGKEVSWSSSVVTPPGHTTSQQVSHEDSVCDYNSSIPFDKTSNSVDKSECTRDPDANYTRHEESIQSYKFKNATERCNVEKVDVINKPRGTKSNVARELFKATCDNETVKIDHTFSENDPTFFESNILEASITTDELVSCSNNSNIMLLSEHSSSDHDVVQDPRNAICQVKDDDITNPQPENLHAMCKGVNTSTSLWPPEKPYSEVNCGRTSTPVSSRKRPLFGDVRKYKKEIVYSGFGDIPAVIHDPNSKLSEMRALMSERGKLPLFITNTSNNNSSQFESDHPVKSALSFIQKGTLNGFFQKHYAQQFNKFNCQLVNQENQLSKSDYSRNSYCNKSEEHNESYKGCNTALAVSRLRNETTPVQRSNHELNKSSNKESTVNKDFVKNKVHSLCNENVEGMQNINSISGNPKNENGMESDIRQLCNLSEKDFSVFLDVTQNSDKWIDADEWPDKVDDKISCQFVQSNVVKEKNDNICTRPCNENETCLEKQENSNMMENKRMNISSNSLQDKQAKRKFRLGLSVKLKNKNNSNSGTETVSGYVGNKQNNSDSKLTNSVSSLSKKYASGKLFWSTGIHSQKRVNDECQPLTTLPDTKRRKMCNEDVSRDQMTPRNVIQPKPSTSCNSEAKGCLPVCGSANIVKRSDAADNSLKNNISSNSSDIHIIDSATDEIPETKIFNTVKRSNNNEKLKVPTKFQGFSTASGREVLVSKEALNKAKQFLSEKEIMKDAALSSISVDHLLNNDMLEIKRKTENEKKTTLQDNDNRLEGGLPYTNHTFAGSSLNSGQTPFHPNMNEIEVCNVDNKTNAEKYVNKVSVIGERKVLHPQNSFVNNTVSTIPQKVTSAIDNCTNFQAIKANKQEESYSVTSMSAVGGKSDIKTQQVLNRGKKRPCEILANEASNFSGFSTASGKKVEVSKLALNRAKEILADCDKLNTGLPPLNTNSKPYERYSGCAEIKETSRNSSSKLMTFSTGTDNNSTVSKLPLNEMKGFAETKTQEELTVHKFNAAAYCNKMTSSRADFQGFSTASGKNINLSGNALSKARQIFSESDLSLKLPPLDTKTELENCISNSVGTENKENDGRVTTGKGAIASAVFLNKASETHKELSPSLDNKQCLLKEEKLGAKHQISEADEELNKWKQMLFEDDYERVLLLISDGEILSKEDSTDKIKATQEKCYNPKYKTKEFQKSACETVNFCDGLLESSNKPHSDKSILKHEFENNNMFDTTSDQNVPSFELILSPVLETLNVPCPDVEKYNKNIIDNASLETHVSDEFDFATSPVIGSNNKNICHARSKAATVDIERHKEITVKDISSLTSDQSQVKRAQSSENIRRIKKRLFEIPKSSSVFNAGGDTTHIKMKPESKSSTRNIGIIFNLSKLDETGNAMTNVSDEELESISFTQKSFPVTSYVSSPDIFEDRSVPPVVSFVENDGLPTNPVVGLESRFKLNHSQHLVDSFTDDLFDSSTVDWLDCSTDDLVDGSDDLFDSSTDDLVDSSTDDLVDNSTDDLVYSSTDDKEVQNASSILHPRKIEFRFSKGLLRPVDSGRNSTCSETNANRMKAISDQEMRIEEGRKTGVKSYKGSYFQKRKDNKLIPLKDVVSGHFPRTYSSKELLQMGIKDAVVNVTAMNAVDYRFSINDFCSSRDSVGISTEDGALLVPDHDGFIGVKEFTRAFLSCSGVDPSLSLHENWISNHYRWIVWKLACTERSFPQQFRGYLSPNNVMALLRYRYDKEMVCNQRPALRKILERDDVSTKRLVLCVANITKKTDDRVPSESKSPELSDYELELTDGWYSVMAAVDIEMTRLIESVTVGTKLITCGAELLNCSQGCSPLEVDKNVRLRIHTNSTRRARWCTKLGFQSNPDAFPISLSSVLPNGGIISCVPVVIARVYPTIYVEVLPNEKIVIRGARAEKREAAKFEKERQDKAEEVLSQLRKDMIDKIDRKTRKSYKRNNSKMTSNTSVEELYQILTESSDPSYFQYLTEEQKQELISYQRRQQDVLNNQLQARLKEKLEDVTRNVVPVLKVRCLDAYNLDNESCSAVLFVGHASEDVMNILKEGTSLKVFNIDECRYSSKKRCLLLSSSRDTRYEPLEQNVVYPERRVTELRCLADIASFRPLFSEVDVVGVVVCTRVNSSNSEIVYVADGTSLAAILFEGSVKDFGYEDTLMPEKVIAANNLHWLPTGDSRIPSVRASQVSVFSQNPRQRYLREALENLQEKIGPNVKSFVLQCKELIDKPEKAIAGTNNTSTHSNTTNMTLPVTPCVKNSKNQ